MDKRKRRLLCMLEGSGRKSRWISGAPPLSFKAKKAGTLENYRIYGNTVDGESVGDLVTSGEHAGEYKVPVTVEGKNLVSSYLVGNSRERYAVTLWCEIDFKPNTEYIIDFIYAAGAQFYTNEYIFETVLYTNTLGGKRSLRIKTKSTIDKNSDYQYNANEGWIILKNNTKATEDIEISDVQIRLAPVTTPIYLPEQIRKVGDDAEYIDYGEQKQYFADGTETDVTLPALPTLPGTNVLSVGTAVQPSNIEIKGKIKDL